ncbi:hypothetical protein [Sphaerotilus montanus]|uniref:hypothetical protein n=1 Tax=Sphaerotilus montanus TaxID=522889 RepID=UPI003FA33317
MAGIEYSLFRAKFIIPQQKSLFHGDLKSIDYMTLAIESKPTFQPKEGLKWHVGNLKKFESFRGYFAFGRSSASSIAKYDEYSGNFIEEEQEESPFTHCVYDSRIGILGIARKTELAPTTTSIANRLGITLSTVEIITEHKIRIEILPIPDPEGFINTLQNSYRVYKFKANFKGPNPFDADTHFQKPSSVYISAAGGIEGSTTIKGDDLNRDVIIEVTRSTASTGNEASARVQKNIGQKAININLKGDPVKRRYDEIDHVPEIVLNDLINQYNRVRHAEVN